MGNEKVNINTENTNIIEEKQVETSVIIKRLLSDVEKEDTKIKYEISYDKKIADGITFSIINNEGYLLNIYFISNRSNFLLLMGYPGGKDCNFINTFKDTDDGDKIIKHTIKKIEKLINPEGLVEVESKVYNGKEFLNKFGPLFRNFILPITNSNLLMRVSEATTESFDFAAAKELEKATQNDTIKTIANSEINVQMQQEPSSSHHQNSIYYASDMDFKTSHIDNALEQKNSGSIGNSSGALGIVAGVGVVLVISSFIAGLIYKKQSNTTVSYKGVKQDDPQSNLPPSTIESVSCTIGNNNTLYKDTTYHC